jgi:starvation-inducible DNA-binding protein
MSQLITELEEVLGDAVVFYFRAHGYHWNVEGEDFSAYHELFQTIYEDVYSSIDPIAENLRKLDSYAPFKLDSFLKLSSLEDSRVATDPRSMAVDLMAANDIIIGKLKECFNTANQADEQGIANFIAERIDMHQKWRWQLKASTK